MAHFDLEMNPKDSEKAQEMAAFLKANYESKHSVITSWFFIAIDKKFPNKRELERKAFMFSAITTINEHGANAFPTLEEFYSNLPEI